MKRLQLWSTLLFVLLFLVLTAVPSTEAASPRNHPPENNLEALSAESLAGFVDAFVAEKMTDAHAPGLVITVVSEGDVLLSQGYGLADQASRRPMTAQTNLRVGSVSKPVTSAAVLQLVAGGQMALDAPVSEYLPDLPLADGYGPAGSVAQMLTLKGGYPDKVLQSHAPTLAAWQPLDVYLQDNLPPRVLPPGKVHSYNSWEHALLGQAMAKVSGQPFPQVMDETLLQPLGMARSTFDQPLPDAVAANLASGYHFQDGAYQEVPLDYVNLSPGIALVTTGEDMGRFMLALLNNGVLDGRPVLAPATVAGMLQRQEPVHPLSRGRTYGFSEVTLAGHPVLYHDGNGIGFSNRIILDPEHRLGIFLSTNHRLLAPDLSHTAASIFIKDLSVALLEHYLPASEEGAETPLAPLPDAAARAPRYAGNYYLAGTPRNDFFKLNALLDNVNVGDNGDGTITIGSNRYVEVEPLLFQSTANPGFFVVFAEGEEGAVELLTFGGTGSYQKADWYVTPTAQIALLAIMLFGFLALVIVIPFSRYRPWTIWLMSLVNIVFLAGLTIMMLQVDPLLFFKSISLQTRLLFLLPWLGGVLALTYPWVLASLWRQGSTPRVWSLYALNIAATVAFFWFVSTWNLYRF